MATLALLTPTRPGFHRDPSVEELQALGEHFSYLKGLAAAGRVVLAGPAEDGSLGLVVFPRDDTAAAQELMAKDPCVVGGVMRCEVRPFRMALFGTGSTRDWLGFTQAIHIRAGVPAVWRAIATCEGMEQWFLRRCEAFTADGRAWPRDRAFEGAARIRMTWICAGQPDGSGVVRADDLAEEDSIETCEPPQRLRLGWYEDKGWVEFRVIARTDGRTTLELEQRMHPHGDFAFLEGVYVGCQQGWTFYLANLKSVLEHGKDLREEAPDRKGLVNH